MTDELNNSDYHSLPADVALRRMDHRQWLSQFAFVLETSPKGGPQMTPFRAGAIGRLRLAAQYIELLEHEAKQSRREIAALKARLDDQQLDRDLDRHQEGR
jgi:hypothetical protein